MSDLLSKVFIKQKTLVDKISVTIHSRFDIVILHISH